MGCSIKSVNYEPKEVVYYEPKYYLNFNDNTLNSLINSALKNNQDLKLAALNLKQAMLKANLTKSNFYPTPSISLDAKTNKNISDSTPWSSGFSNKLSISYEIDIFGKIMNDYDSLKWQSNLARLKMQDLRLSIVNSISSAYFNILYLNSALHNLNEYEKNLKKLNEIVMAKYLAQKEDKLSLDQSQQSLLNVQNQILSYKKELESNYEVIKNLTNTDDDLSLGFDTKIPSISLDVDYLALENRPDLNAAAASLNASFYDYKAGVKSLYPSISIGSSISGSAGKFIDSFGFKILSGNISINLPFLNYAKLKNNIKISYVEFEKRKTEYEKTLSKATNEVIKYLNQYKLDNEIYKNLFLIVRKNESILEIYEKRYGLGSDELKTLLEAKNSLINSQNSLLLQKYKLINDVLNYYKAIAK